MHTSLLFSKSVDKTSSAGVYGARDIHRPWAVSHHEVLFSRQFWQTVVVGQVVLGGIDLTLERQAPSSPTTSLHSFAS